MVLGKYGQCYPSPCTLLLRSNFRRMAKVQFCCSFLIFCWCKIKEMLSHQNSSILLSSPSPIMDTLALYVTCIRQAQAASHSLASSWFLARMAINFKNCNYRVKNLDFLHFFVVSAIGATGRCDVCPSVRPSSSSAESATKTIYVQHFAIQRSKFTMDCYL